MAIKISTLEQPPVTVDELVSFLDNSPYIERFRHSVYDSKDMQVAASWLRALASAKTCLVARIMAELDDPQTFQVSNPGQAQSFLLHPGEYYTLRLMLWAPSEKKVLAPLSYGFVHDHDFDLMSAGVYGPGYRTSLYQFDYDEPAHQHQGLARLNYQGEAGLKEGETIYYFASKDVHRQYSPVSLSVSVSLNLLIRKPDAGIRQTVFDLSGPPENGIVLGRARYNSQDKLNSQKSILAVLARLENARSRDIILQIARSHDSEEVRALAWASLLNSGTPELSWYQECRCDRSFYVRKMAGKQSSVFPEEDV